MTLMVLAGAGVGAWALRRSYRQEERRQLAAGSGYDEDAEVALHVARHEALTRHHQWLSSMHVLYGLLQDEAVAAAVRDAGGDPDALEDRVLAALDAHDPEIHGGREGGAMLAYARASAQQGGRKAGCTDLWAALRFGPEARALCDAAGLDDTEVLFRLFHGEVPSLGERLTGDLDVVLRNDHWTTKEFVCEVLEEVFALERTTAITHMEATHEQGQAVVGRFRAADARARVALARERARAGGHPLWIGVMPA